jgi:ankyrin repeat protein
MSMWKSLFRVKGSTNAEAQRGGKQPQSGPITAESPQELLDNAVREGNLESIKALIAAGADVNAKSELGMTVLMRAATFGKVDVVKALIAAGANVNAKDNDGQTALMRAAYDELVGHEDSDGADCIEALIAAGVNVNEKDNRSETALMRAAHGGNADSVRALIAAGADVNAKKENGDLVLITAACSAKGAFDKVRALITAGADVNTRDSSGNTALALSGHKEVTALLRQHALERSSRTEAESKVRKMAFELFRKHGLTWNQDGFLAFLESVRSRVPAELLSEGDIRRVLEDQRRKICPECQTPLYSFGISWEAGIGSYALFSCGKCGQVQKLKTQLINKARGIDVLCSCGAVTHVPPSVWCNKCGVGFPEDWQSKLSRKI